STDDLRTALKENDATLVLLVDGLDEVPGPQRARVLVNLAPVRFNSEEFCGVVLTTRPVNPNVVNGESITRLGYLALELLPFDDLEVSRLIGMLLPEESKANEFRAALDRVNWDKGSPTPLQIRVAFNVFQSYGCLPPRAIDLSVFFVNRLMAQARESHT